MYHKLVESRKSKVESKKKSFTLVEVIVVMGVMGLIIGGLLVSMRQIIEGEMLLKRMQAVEEESRFIMDLFAQDAQYSELGNTFKPSDDGNPETNEQLFVEYIPFLLVEKKGELGVTSSNQAEYMSYFKTIQQGSEQANQYYLQRNITGDAEDLAVTLNNTPLSEKPLFRVRRLASTDGAENYMITISLVFQVESKNGPVYIPIQTSVVSRTFEI